MTFTLNVDVEPEKKTAILTWKDIPPTSIVDTEVTLKVKLTTPSPAFIDLKGGNIDFYANNTKLNPSHIITDVNGLAEFPCTFTGVGLYNLKAKFIGGEVTGILVSGDYNPAETTEHALTVGIEEEKLLHISSVTPTELPNGFYGVTAPMTINVIVTNNTSETVEVRAKLTAKAGATLLDEEPDVIGIVPFWKNISAGDTWLTTIGVPSPQFTELVISDEWLQVELWKQYATTPADIKKIKVGTPEEEVEPSLWDNIITFISDTFGVTKSQAKLIAYAGIALLGIMLFSSMIS